MERNCPEKLKEAQARIAALEKKQQEMIAKETLQKELFRHTVQAQEQERARISHELHDETAQILSAFSLELAALQNRLDEPAQRLAPTLERLQTLSKEMHQGIYRLVNDLRPAQLDDLGLVAAIQNLIGDECCKMNLDISLLVSGEPQRIAPEIETVLYRVAQAALTNVARHARTQQAEIQICFDAEKVVMQVKDQGIGFNLDADFIAPRGWGLAGMKERISAIGGQLTINSKPQKGTIVTTMIPGQALTKEKDL